ncbi:MAG: lmo0937 family membrane protein [bacterium]|nr:lmo0937 family membrane protein [bacterium]
MIEIIAIILLVLWLGGFALHIAGGLIHILLVIAIIVFLLRFIKKGV